MRVFKTRLRARYAETDASGIVYYNSYFLYFEVGRVEMFRELGLAYDRRLPIVETSCRFRASARFDDLLEVRSFVREIRRRAFSIGAEVYRLRKGEAPALLAEGYTAMATTGAPGELIPLPPGLRAALELCLAGGSQPLFPVARGLRGCRLLDETSTNEGLKR